MFYMPWKIKPIDKENIKKKISALNQLLDILSKEKQTPPINKEIENIKGLKQKLSEL